jgi:hypothetical protein
MSLNCSEKFSAGLDAFRTMIEPGTIKMPFRWSNADENEDRDDGWRLARPTHDTPQYQTEDDRLRAEEYSGSMSVLVNGLREVKTNAQIRVGESSIFFVWPRSLWRYPVLIWENLGDSFHKEG